MQAFVTARLISRCDINFYRGQAWDYARKVKLIGLLPGVMETLRKSKIGILSVGNVTDVTFLQANRMESRSHVHMSLLYEETTLDEVKIYDFVDLEVINDVRTEHASAVQKPDAFEPWAWGMFYSGETGFGDMVPIDKDGNIRLLRKSEERARVLVYVQNDMGQNDNISDITLNGASNKEQWRTDFRAQVDGLPAVGYYSNHSTTAKDVIITITTK